LNKVEKIVYQMCCSWSLVKFGFGDQGFVSLLGPTFFLNMFLILEYSRNIVDREDVYKCLGKIEMMWMW